MKLPFPNLLTPKIQSPNCFIAFTTTNLPSPFDRGLSNYRNHQFTKRLHLITLCSITRRSNPFKNSSKGTRWKSGIRNPISPSFVSKWAKFSIRDNAFLFLTSMAFISIVVAAVPTLFAMRRAAISFAKLVETAHLELPNTMAAIRLSSMELSDLTLELNDLKQDISEGVINSAPSVEESEDGDTKIGAVAYKQTIPMVYKRVNFPRIASQRFGSVAGKKASGSLAAV